MISHSRAVIGLSAVLFAAALASPAAASAQPADPGCYVQVNPATPSGGGYSLPFTHVCSTYVRAYVKDKYLGLTETNTGAAFNISNCSSGCTSIAGYRGSSRGLGIPVQLRLQQMEQRIVETMKEALSEASLTFSITDDDPEGPAVASSTSAGSLASRQFAGSGGGGAVRGRGPDGHVLSPDAGRSRFLHRDLSRVWRCDFPAGHRRGDPRQPRLGA